MKFTIRDLLWLTVVIALAVAWWLDHRRLTQESQKFRNFVEFYERDLVKTRSSGFPVPPGRVIPGTVVSPGR